MGNNSIDLYRFSINYPWFVFILFRRGEGALSKIKALRIFLYYDKIFCISFPVDSVLDDNNSLHFFL